ncbi:hypothetical protein ACEQ8H_004932 [Pleosporales sp. CAS-2024a]
MFSATSSSPSWLRILLVASVLSTICLAQDSASSIAAIAKSQTVPSIITSSRPSSTSSAAAQTHTVQVGLADHKMKPDVTQANVGDTVEFRFYPANHSVVRAEYGFPCIPYEMTGNNKQGFFSGFQAVDKVLDDPPKWSLKINDTNPIFFYCSAPGSCITYGMVGAINPNASTPIETQQQKAKNSTYMLSPGEPFPLESPLPSNLPSSTAIPMAPTPEKHSALSSGAIAGIVVGAVAVLALAAALFFFVGRSKKLKDEVDRKETQFQNKHHQPHNFSSSDDMSSLSPRNNPPDDATHNAFSPAHDKYPFANSHTRLAAQYMLLAPPRHPAYSSPTTTTTTTTTTRSIYDDNDNNNNNNNVVLHPRAPHELEETGPAKEAHAYPYPYPYAAKADDTTLSSAAPPYGWHVNGVGTPAEMEGTPVARARPRWEEVGARRAGEAVDEEGTMFF